MATNAASVLLSAETLAEWDKNRKDAQDRADTALREVAYWDHQIEAAKKLLDGVAMGATQGAPFTKEDDGLATAIVTIVKQAGGEIASKELRSRLRARGVPNRKLDNYYYTVIARLKDKKRIEIGPDKRVTLLDGA